MQNIQQDKQLISLALQGLKQLFISNFDKVLIKKNKDKFKQIEINEKYNVYNMFIVPKKPILKYPQLIDEKLRIIQNERLQYKYFDNNQHTRICDLMLEDIKNFDILASMYYKKINLQIKNIETQDNSIKNLTEQLFPYYLQNDYINEEEFQILGEKCMRSCQQDQLQLDLKWVQLKSKMQQKIKYQEIEKIINKINALNIMKIQKFPLSMIQHHKNEYLSVFNQLFLSNQTIEACFPKTKYQWSKDLIQKQQQKYISSQIKGRQLYIIEIQMQQLREKLLQNNQKQFNKKNPKRKTNININQTFINNKMLPKRQIIDNKYIKNVPMQVQYESPHKKIQRNNVINRIDLPYRKQAIMDKPNYAYQMKNKKNCVKYQPPEHIKSLNIYEFRKSKEIKRKYQNFKRQREGYYNNNNNKNNPVMSEYVYNNQNKQRFQSKKIQNKSLIVNNLHLGNKQIENNQFFPYKLGPLIVQSQTKSYLFYPLISIDQKELTLRFLIDREKFGENTVVIGIDYEKSLNSESQIKLKTILKILDCLGARALCQSTRIYRKYNMKNSTKIFISAILLKIPVNQIIKQCKYINMDIL